MGYASITRPVDNRAVLGDGVRSGDRGLTVHVRKTGAAEARLGLVVKASTAVTRNRVKRRLRAAAREAGLATGSDVVIRADERAAGKDFQEMVATIRGAIEGAGG